MGLVLQLGLTRKMRRKAKFEQGGMKIEWDGSLTNSYFFVNSVAGMRGLVKRYPGDEIPRKEALVLLPAYYSIAPFRVKIDSQPLLRLKNQDGLGLFYSDTMVLPSIYDALTPMENFFYLKKNEKVGLFYVKDSTGLNNRLIEPEFTSIQPIVSTGYAKQHVIYKAIYEDGSFCYISSKGIKYGSK